VTRKKARQGRGDQSVEVFCRVVGEGFGDKNARIVYQHVYAAKPGYDSIADLCGRFRVADVSIDQRKIRGRREWICLVMFREFATTLYPRFRTSSTSAAPIPWEAPVTTAVFCIFAFSSSFYCATCAGLMQSRFEGEMTPEKIANGASNFAMMGL
jgi:hypothetical protein